MHIELLTIGGKLFSIARVTVGNVTVTRITAIN